MYNIVEIRGPHVPRGRSNTGSQSSPGRGTKPEAGEWTGVMMAVQTASPTGPAAE